MLLSPMGRYFSALRSALLSWKLKSVVGGVDHLLWKSQLLVRVPMVFREPCAAMFNSEEKVFESFYRGVSE